MSYKIIIGRGICVGGFAAAIRVALSCDHPATPPAAASQARRVQPAPTQSVAQTHGAGAVRRNVAMF